ncbi:MAG: hypothetical protein Kow00121_50990 [Elainellaceae cyanobacterium]
MLGSKPEQLNLKSLEPLEPLEQPEQLKHLSQPFVSVIIPVYNDAKRLKLCLDALEHQTYPGDRYEVVVVDNGSDANENIAGVADSYRQVIVTQELTPGSYAARNTGIAVARGEVIAFTDADCIPASNWIEMGVHHLLQTSNCGMVVGNIEIFPQDSDCPTPVELFEMATAFPQEHHLKTLRYGATANLFTLKSVLEQVGGFHQDLKSGGDLDWGRRVYASGYQQIYSQDVQVAHPARATFQQMQQKVTRLAGGHYDLLKRNLYHFFYQDSLPFAIANLKLFPPVIRTNLIFLLILVQDLIPPVMYVITASRSPKLKSWNEKFKVALVIVFVRYSSAWAKIRLRIGASPART